MLSKYGMGTLAGTVVVMNAHLWHGGTANRSAKPRLAMHAFYCLQAGVPEGADLATTPLSPPENHFLKIDGNSTLSPDGTLTGIVNITAEGQTDAGICGLFRTSPKTQWSSNVEKELLKISPLAEVTGIDFGDPIDYKSGPVHITIEYRIPEYALVSGDKLLSGGLRQRRICRRHGRQKAAQGRTLCAASSSEKAAATKSGGNQLRGLFNLTYEPISWIANNIDAAATTRGFTGVPNNKFWELHPDVGGPIVRDRLWFFGDVFAISLHRCLHNYLRPPFLRRWP